MESSWKLSALTALPSSASCLALGSKHLTYCLLTVKDPLALEHLATQISDRDSQTNHSRDGYKEP